MIVQEVVARLHELSDEGHRSRLTRFGIVYQRALGIPVPKLRALAKEVGKDQKLAVALWKTRIHEARILATSSCGASVVAIVAASTVTR